MDFLEQFIKIYFQASSTPQLDCHYLTMVESERKSNLIEDSLDDLVSYMLNKVV